MLRVSIRAALIVGLISAALGGSAAAQDNVYFGNLHAHTVYSDGSGTPDDAFKAAKAAGLNFMALTEHSHKAAEGAGDSAKIHIARDHTLYNGPQAASLISTAARRTTSGSFVAIYGQEYSTIKHGNHVNVFDAPEVIDIPNNEFKQLIAWTAAHPDSSGRPSILQFNHPALDNGQSEEYGRDDFPSAAAWLAAMDAQAELIEVFNGPAMAKTSGNRSAAVQENDYYYYLNLGFHLAPSVGHDNHYRTWGDVTDARVAVISPQLTKTGVLDALRARHAYATSDKNLRLVFRAGSALQGDVVTAPQAADDDLPLTLTLKDDDEADASYRIDVFSDVPGGTPIDGDAPTNTFLLEGDTSGPMSLDGVPYKQAGQYVVVRVTQISENPEEEDVAWTAPIWFGGSAPGAGLVGGGAAPVRAVSLTKVLPDPAGPDLRNERIWLRNNTAAPINLSGWVLVDLSGNTWPLTGTLPANQERYYQRNGEDLSLNNDGDRLELRDASGAVVQVATYGPAARGAEVPIP